MFVDIKEYMKLSREERMRHIDLEEDCIKIGGRSDYFRGLLCHFLGTTMPIGMGVHLCHACNQGDCSNPKHLYWGTAFDNSVTDQKAAGRHRSLWELTVIKHGEARAREILRANASKGGKAARNQSEAAKRRHEIARQKKELANRVKLVLEEPLSRTQKDGGQNTAP
jgi:hypothetical protein